MTRKPGAFAVVALPSLDVRRRPAHAAELGTQLMIGEVVRVRGADRSGLWWRVEGFDDGYRGWARSWGLIPASRARAGRWLARARGRVRAPYTEVLTTRGSGALVSPLFWNGRVMLGPRRGSWARVELPDGRRGWVRAGAVAKASDQSPTLIQRLRTLLGAPYLWGGRTAMGFDCSGLVQQMFLEQGVALPRDAHDQAGATRRLGPKEPPGLGDLVFFGPRRGRILHVGLCLGGGLYAHSRGKVMINSLEPSNRLYDKALGASVRGVGRVKSGLRIRRRPASPGRISR